MKSKSMFLAAVLAGSLFFPMTVGAWMLVPSLGDTGWQTYQRSFTGGFAGTVGFVVSNEFDMNTDYSSYLLLDNLSQATSNAGFEDGSYTGFSLQGSGDVINSYIFSPTTIYSPTEGTHLSLQTSDNQTVITSSFLNYYGNPGTNGSILETSISIAAGGTFSFDWAFATDDESPYEDFSLVYFKNSIGTIAFSDGLGQLNQTDVPEPATLILVGAGLTGLAGFRRKMK